MSEETRSAFVAGATGFTGREVVRVLRDRGVETIAHIRPGSSSMDRWAPAFEALGATVDTTPWEPDAMLEQLQDLAPDLVFGCLGTTRKRASKEGMAAAEAYEKVDYGLTSLLLEAAVAAGAERFVYLSAAGIGESEPRGAYMKARWRVEQELKDADIEYTIARPSFIVGDREESRPMEKAGATVIDGLLAGARLLGARKLAERYSSTTNTILATALVRKALEPESESEILASEDLRLD